MKKPELVIVAMGSAPSSAHLLRWALDQARSRGAECTALFVDTGAAIGAGERRRLDDNLCLARALGARVEVLPGRDVAATILFAACERGASLVVVGRSGIARRRFPPERASISDRIVRGAGPLPVAVLQDGKVPPLPRAVSGRRQSLRRVLSRGAELFLAIAAMVLVGLVAAPVLTYHGVALLYIAAVLALSIFASPAAAAGSALLSALALNFFFIPPRFTLTIAALEDWILFGSYFLVAFVTGALVTRLRSRERLLAQRQAASSFLLRAAESLAPRSSILEATRAAAALASEYFGLGIGFAARPPGEERSASAIDAMGDAAETAFAEACRSGPPSIVETPIGRAGRLRTVPATAGERIRIFAGVELPDGRVWTVADDELLSSLGKTLSLIAERERSEEESRRAYLELGSQRLAKTLLDSVSHEMRTPLTTITGSLSALRDDELAERAESRRAILDGALEAAASLDRIVEDLLSAGRIESGLLRLKREPTDAAEIARTAAEDAAPSLAGRELTVSLGAPPVVADVDAALVSRLAANLLRNAGRYSRAGGAVALEVAAEGSDLVVRVADSGPGPQPERLASFFEKMRKAEGDPRGGLGLGLAICRGIAEAHGGNIRAISRPGRFIVEARFPACAASAAEERL